MSYHFIGLGGIGMSALARILLQQGKSVQGSDQKRSPLLEELEREGAKIFIGHDENLVQEDQVIVYGSAIPKDHIELLKARRLNNPIFHRSDLLHELIQGKKALLVAGTHGKTTTSALLSHVLMEAQKDPSFAIGGILKSLKTNAYFGRGDYFVAEADESDGSFTRSLSYAAILTNLEDDHLDFWGASKMLDIGFQKFIHQCEHLIWCADSPRLCRLQTKGTSYGFSKKADVPIRNYLTTKTGSCFCLGPYENIELSLHGAQNVQNAAAVFILAKYLQISEEIIRKSFQNFEGVRRRLELLKQTKHVALFDDYGHHPNEIRACLKALREKIGERRIIVLFQPHRYSRIKALFQEYLSAFDEADVVFVTPIYPANELPVQGLSRELFLSLKEKSQAKIAFANRENLVSEVASKLRPFDVILTLGAGDITKEGLPILEEYEQRDRKIRLAVLFGGASLEHEVSLMSAKNILASIDAAFYETHLFKIAQDGHWGYESICGLKKLHRFSDIFQELSQCDVCLPIFHGPRGEDGMIAAVLDTLDIPYVGCDYRSGAICMQKAWTKRLVSHHNVPIVPFLEFEASTYYQNRQSIRDKIEAAFQYPVWIKPVHLGSSIAVKRVHNREELEAWIPICLESDDVLIIEKDMKARQIEFCFIGNASIRKAEPAEIINHESFVGFDEKYGEKALPIQVPAKLTDLEKQIGYELAEKVYRICRCQGLARVDFFIDEKGYFWFNEINPFPGFTPTSAFPLAWEKSGMPLTELINEIIILGLVRKRKGSRRCLEAGA